MLSLKQIENVKIKMVKLGLNQQKLARQIRCSNGALSQIFNQEKDFPNIENRLLGWYKDPTAGNGDLNAKGKGHKQVSTL